MSARVLPFRTSQQRMPSPEDIEAREVASMFATLRQYSDIAADALKFILAERLKQAQTQGGAR